MRRVLLLAAAVLPWTVTGARTAISEPILDWQRQGTPMNEGPVAIQHNGRTFITCSASACQGPDYKIGPIDPLVFNAGGTIRPVVVSL